MAFRYNVICTLHTHALERVYSQTAVGIFSGELSSPRDILRRFRAVYPEDDDFRAAFARKTFTTSNSRNSKVVRYILFSLEKHLSAKDLDQESKRYTLEHIMPEHPGEDWMVTDDMLDAGLPYRIGNFTLLDAKRNREAANETFSAKKDLYLESEFEITKRIIAEYPEWDEETISLRQEWLAKQAAAIWRIQFDK